MDYGTNSLSTKKLVSIIVAIVPVLVVIITVAVSSGVIISRLNSVENRVGALYEMQKAYEESHVDTKEMTHILKLQEKINTNLDNHLTSLAKDFKSLIRSIDALKEAVTTMTVKHEGTMERVSRLEDKSK